jgi:hypothetical protein
MVDEGPMMRDAQKRPIPFVSSARIPMVAATAGGTCSLLKATMRLGPTISKPILSMFQMIDHGAEFTLKSSGCTVKMGRSTIPLERVNNSLAMRVRTFDTDQGAKDAANEHFVAGIEEDNLRSPQNLSGGEPSSPASTTRLDAQRLRHGGGTGESQSAERDRSTRDEPMTGGSTASGHAAPSAAEAADPVLGVTREGDKVENLVLNPMSRVDELRAPMVASKGEDPEERLRGAVPPDPHGGPRVVDVAGATRELPHGEVPRAS